MLYEWAPRRNQCMCAGEWSRACCRCWSVGIEQKERGRTSSTLIELCSEKRRRMIDCVNNIITTRPRLPELTFASHYYDCQRRRGTNQKKIREANTCSLAAAGSNWRNKSRSGRVCDGDYGLYGGMMTIPVNHGQQQI